MKQTTISITVDQALKNNFSKLCEEVGLSLNSVINLFMKNVVKEKKIPIEIQNDQLEISRNNARMALNKMRQMVAESDKPFMSLEEINLFINDVRNGR